MARERKKLDDPSEDNAADEQTLEQLGGLEQLGDDEIDAAVSNLEPAADAGELGAPDAAAPKGSSPAMTALWNVVARLEVIVESLRVSIKTMAERAAQDDYDDDDDDDTYVVANPIPVREGAPREADKIANHFNRDGGKLVSSEGDNFFEVVKSEGTGHKMWGDSAPHCVWVFHDGSAIISFVHEHEAAAHTRNGAWLWDVLDENGTDSRGTTWGMPVREL